MSARTAHGVALAAGVAAFAGCHGASPPEPRAPLTPVADAHPAVAPKAPGAARARFAGSITRGGIGPFLARGPTGGLIAWIASKDRGPGQDLDVVPLGADGAPFGAPKAATTVPTETTALVLRSSGGSHPGWTAAWTAVLDRGEGISTVALAPDGSMRAGPFDVERTTDHIAWADVVPTPKGGVCVWVEQSAGGETSLLTAPLDTDGKPRGLPVRVTRGVIGWSAVHDGDGVALALVTPSSAGGKGAGALAWWRLDGEGRPRAAPVPVGARPTVSGDVDVVELGTGWLLAWNDPTGEDAQVMLAAVDAAGKVTGPSRALEAAGGAALEGLAAGPAGAALAWSEPRARERPLRSVHLATVRPEGPTAQAMTSFDVAGQSTPELVSTETGFALLAPARVCGAGDGPLCSPTVAPTFVRLDRRLEPAQTEPLLVAESGGPASLGWNLRCLGDSCEVLAADGASPTGIFTVDLAPRTSPFRAPLTAPPPPEAPRVTGVSTLATAPAISDLATVRLGDATLVASMGPAAVDVEGARGAARLKAKGATVTTRLFDAQGRLVDAPMSLTIRALPAGGIALAAAPKAEDGGAAAWVARDSGDLQVHVALLDPKGKRGREVQVTSERGDASDVALAPAGDGWIVAWVDARDGNGEVYAARLDHRLERVGAEQRVTKAPGDASDVAIAVQGERAFLTWSDPRESPRDGLGDIYARVLRAGDARPDGDEVHVLATAAHSRSPAMVAQGDGALITWIEDPPQGVEASGSAMVVRLDGRGRPATAPQPLPLAEPGSPGAVAMAPTPAGARVFVARSHKADVSLDAMALRADGSVVGQAWRLLDLDAPGTFDVTLAAEMDGVVFDDVAAGGAGHRVRRATVLWPR